MPWGLLVGVSRVRRCAMGIAGGRVACAALCHGDCWWASRVGGAGPWGWACRVGGRVAWVPLCHGDFCWARCVGGAAPWGLLLGASRGWRRGMGIAASRGWRWAMGIAAGWVALCHGDCCWACRVGGAVPWGLLVGVSRGWRRVLGIADRAFVWVAPCLGIVWLAPCLRDC